MSYISGNQTNGQNSVEEFLVPAFPSESMALFFQNIWNNYLAEARNVHTSVQSAQVNKAVERANKKLVKK